MGHVWVKARIWDPERRHVAEVEALVDTGATFTVIPRRLALELGLGVTRVVPVATAGGVVRLERTRMWIEIEGREEVVPAVISDVVDKVPIGVTTLEVLGLRVDPVARRLVEWTYLLY